MAWPKKDTRRIKVGGEVFVWHLTGNDLEGKERPITIGKEKGKFVLHLDPYVWETTVTPSTIREVILWATKEGWSAESGPTRSLAYSRESKTYVWLPIGIRYLYKMPK